MGARAWTHMGCYSEQTSVDLWCTDVLLKGSVRHIGALCCTGAGTKKLLLFFCSVSIPCDMLGLYPMRHADCVQLDFFIVPGRLLRLCMP